jgi:hypothetical protein
MGSFPITCGVSGLPIESGERVRYLLITENPYKTKTPVCDSIGRYFPRTWPIRATYDSYGSIDGYSSEDADLIMRGFQKDLLEIGTGDNRYTDLRVRKDMSFSELLTSIREGRVSVLRDIRKKQKTTNPPWKEIEDTLQGAFPDVAFQVDEGVAGVRVRLTTYQDPEGQLVKASELLNATYAVALTAGSGRSPNQAELKVFFKPGMGMDEGLEGSSERVQIHQVMIREDVWQNLLCCQIQAYDNDPVYNLSEYTKAVRLRIEAFRKQLSEFPSLAEDLLLSLMSYHPELKYKNIGRGILINPIPYTVALPEHFLLRFKDGLVDESFILGAAEFLYVQDLLERVRHIWHPSDVAGPNEPAYQSHRDFSRAILDIAERLAG